MSTVAIIGTGCVGLTTGVCLAHLGHTVTCADVNPLKVDRLSRGEPTMFEDGLADLLRDGLSTGRLHFVIVAAAAVADAEVAFLCLPTPQRHDGAADLSAIDAVCAEIAALLPKASIVVNKSTVPVGTARRVAAMIGRPDVSVVFNPEFLREGSAASDFLHPDRIVVGSSNRAAASAVALLYDRIDAPLRVTDSESAETIKYAFNAFSPQSCPS